MYLVQYENKLLILSMMNLRLSLVKQIDNRAWLPLAALIHSYLQNHSNVGAIVICENEIRFTKGVFFTLGRIDYTPYQIVCKNGIIYYEGTGILNVPKDDLFVFLVNALRQLRPGYMVKL
jgi:hypothetical protein